MPQGYPIGELTAYGDLMSPYWHAPAGREVVRRFYAQDNERLPQYRTEAVLRRKLATLPQVDMRLGWTCLTIEPEADRIAVTITDANGSDHEVLDPVGLGATLKPGRCTTLSNGSRRARPIACCVRSSRATGSSSAAWSLPTAGSSTPPCPRAARSKPSTRSP